MNRGEIILRTPEGKKCGNVTVNMQFDLQDEMFEMLMCDIHATIEKWEDKVILARRNQSLLPETSQ